MKRIMVTAVLAGATVLAGAAQAQHGPPQAMPRAAPPMVMAAPPPPMPHRPMMRSAHHRTTPMCGHGRHRHACRPHRP